MVTFSIDRKRTAPSVSSNVQKVQMAAFVNNNEGKIRQPCFFVQKLHLPCLNGHSKVFIYHIIVLYREQVQTVLNLVLTLHLTKKVMAPAGLESAVLCSL